MKISFFTMNNPLSLPSFYIATKYTLNFELHIEFCSSFSLQTLSKGGKCVTEQQLKGLLFHFRQLLHRFSHNTNTFFLYSSVQELPRSFQSHDGQASFLAVISPQLLPSEGLVETLFSWAPQSLIPALCPS